MNTKSIDDPIFKKMDIEEWRKTKDLINVNEQYTDVISQPKSEDSEIQLLLMNRVNIKSCSSIVSNQFS